MLSSYEIIFFDAGGTLFHPYPSVGAIYSEVALRHGCPVEPERIERIFREAWLKRDGMAALTNHSSEKIEKEWWSSLVFEVFSQVGGVPAFELFFEELYDVFARPSVWRLYGGALEVLGHLKKKGKRLGIVSNWDSRLCGLFSGLGLDAYFEFVLASAV
ncbi:MAG: HAD family hydrolase, partial [Candidatus Omnitrophota bacterium]